MTGTTDDPVFLTDAERFLAYLSVKDRESHWLWTSHLDHDGYGIFSIKSHPVKAHRFAYKLFVGPIPPGMEIDHVCQVKNCCNPSPKHLEVVTTQENLRRRGPSGFYKPISEARTGDHAHRQFG